jgi:hypothetical protein
MIMSIIVPGFSCYEVIDIENIIDLGDSYNIVWGDNEMFIDKDGCSITDNNIIYKNNDVEIYIEYSSVIG